MKNSKATINLRQQQLLEYLMKYRNCDNKTLSELLSVTPITVRRDLQYLEERGLIKRFFGGAECIMPPESESTFSLHSPNDTISKTRIEIAKRAAMLIQDKETVFMNSSSTALLALEYIQDKSVLIITNNGRSLYTKRHPKAELILTGGEVYGQKQSLVGEFALNTLSKITATKCILGVSGISVAGGITSRVIQETAINQMMLNRCSGDKIVVADGSKIGIEHNFFSGNISDITHLITDSSAPKEHLDSLAKHGLKIIISG
ncbi:MAG: DeoR/GlpR family DNA-binding transcription regulator [Oscillospiraceae bacterium]|nr:DeoR/GlpR family DNA-binding transcription regulator [Oscillospiraceae bacterium]